MRTVLNFAEFKVAWKQEYERLAKSIASFFTSSKGSIGEIGCGGGQLTIPLAKLATNHHIIAVDSF